ncbi:acetyl-CoA carboxylase biotin carboxylase subunit [Melioribacter sp. OK-6-Me]|uniref:acetyl-CoA carboxylase biotin carboxylase subunit n=1 Tax=unclassified Melioribacter TaxID=2627329 RepID=UPI003ED94C68
MFNKILIANRGEIALRIIRACNELGIKTIAIYSDIDKFSPHVAAADEAFKIGEPRAYLNQNLILEIAQKADVDAIHPGYGYLSENENFIKAVEASNITFIGPSSKSVKLMGNKLNARKLMLDSNIPVVPGSIKPIYNLEEAILIANEIGYPIMLKASGGGGGKGIRMVSEDKELRQVFNLTRSEALKAFGNDEIYIEKLIVNPKHIEVQILGDRHGNYAHLFERECSLQRRFQKIIEEAPSPSIDPELRLKITDAAVRAARACNYYNAGTVEFLMDDNHNFYFLEMNTRLQVEHPVTESITGIDIVKEQIKIAAGEKLSFTQDEVSINGHSIECRINSEDFDFSPSTGKITNHKIPTLPGIRVDYGIDIGSDVSLYYDPLLSKVISHGRSRNEALVRMLNALDNYLITDVETNIPLLKQILKSDIFRDASFNINTLKNFSFIRESNQGLEIAAVVSAVLNYSNKFKSNGDVTNNKNKWYELKYD